MVQVVKKKKPQESGTPKGNIIPQKQPTIDATRKQTFQGGKLNKEEFNAFKSSLGFDVGGVQTDKSKALTQEFQEADVKEVARRTIEEQQRNKAIEAALSQIEANKKAEELQGILSQIGETQEPDIKDEGGVTFKQAATNILSGAGAGALTGAATGATAGLVTAGTLSAPAAAAGAVGGAIVGGIGSLVKISADKRQDTKEAFANYTAAKSNINTILTELNAGRATPEEAIEAYNDQLQTIRTAERKLQQLQRTEFRNQLSNARDELIKVEEFRQLESFYNARLRAAVLNPSGASSNIPIENEINQNG